MPQSSFINPLVGNTEYKFIRFLGNGSFGLVVEAEEIATGQHVAIKIILKSTMPNLEGVRREIYNHRRLCHHHVILFDKLIVLSVGLGIVMEFAEGGNLLQYVAERERISPNLVRFIFQQLVFAVDYCHKMNVVNRDIKLQNTLVSGNSEWPMVKLCDFGYSKHNIADSLPNSKVGTLETMAPEVITLEAGQTYSGAKSDIWCLGLLLYNLAVGCSPFYTPEEKISKIELMSRIAQGDYSIPEWVDPDCADLIRKTMVKDPDSRLKTEQIMTHPYFLTGLPPGAIAMNNEPGKLIIKQSIEEINEIIYKALG